jgi:hypothetical protein
MLAAALVLGQDSQQPARGAGQNAPGVGQAAGQQAPGQHLPGQQKPGQQMASHLDGTWHILFLEKDGHKLSGRSDTATIKGNVLTWTQDGREHRVNLRFGSNHMLTAWPDTSEHGAKGQPAAGEPQRGATIPGTRTTGQESAPGQASGAGAGRAFPGVGQANVGHPSARQGVYIDAGEVLCLALDQPFAEGKGPPQAGGQGTPSNQPLARPGLPGPAGTSPALGQLPGGTPSTQPGTAPGSQANGQAGIGQQPGVRHAAYGAPDAGASVQQPGFVIVLHRTGGGQRYQR